MDYAGLVTALGTVLVYPITNPSSATPSSNADFNAFLPSIISGAEQRIYRELDFLATREEVMTAQLSPSTRNVTLPASVIVTQSVGVLTPAGADIMDADAEVVPLLMVSKDFIDQVWPSPGVNKQVPKYFAQLSDTTGIVAPTADDNYDLVVTGTFRPQPLAYNNTTTYITEKYPDLMLYASIVLAAGYQRDYGQQADDPKFAVTWEQMYQNAKQSAFDEEQRRKSASTNWSPYQQTPLSTPRK